MSYLWSNTCSFSGDISHIRVADGGRAAIYYSIVEGDCFGIDNVSCTSSVTDNDPRFVDATRGDLRLRFDSNAIDRGNDDFAPSLDIDGQPRFQDPYRSDGSRGYSDIGAHEYDGRPLLVRALWGGGLLTAVFSRPIEELPAAALTEEPAVEVTSVTLDDTGYRALLLLDGPLDEETDDTLAVDGGADTRGASVAPAAVPAVYLHTAVEVDFADNEMPEWIVRDDDGADTNGPSDWAVVDQALYQRSNIHGEDGDTRYGTRLMMQPSAGSWLLLGDTRFSADIVNHDNDGVGLVFRYLSEGCYHKVDLDSQRSFARVYRVRDGVHEIVAVATERPYLPGEPFRLTVEAAGSEIWVFLDGRSLFDHPIVDEPVVDYLYGALGINGLYTWGSGDDGDVVFDNVVVQAGPH